MTDEERELLILLSRILLPTLGNDPKVALRDSRYLEVANGDKVRQRLVELQDTIIRAVPARGFNGG